MSFHNLRDKLGRFRPMKRSERKLKLTNRPPVAKGKNILNVFLLDDTGSMQSKVSATVDGFNQVLSDAEKASKDTGVKSTDVLALFGEEGHFVVNDRVNKLYFWRYGVSTEGVTLYQPSRPRTALWWAVCEAIKLTDDKLKSMPKNTKVILTIFTDGENNQSYEYETNAKVLVELKQSLGWVINFIGAGERDHIQKMSQSIGIFASNTLNYNNDPIGTRKAFNKMSKSRTAYTSNVASGTAVHDGFFASN